MDITERPLVFHIGEPVILESGLQAYLDWVGASDWTTDAKTDAEKLIEFYGRLCYRSFEPHLNPNVTMVREGSDRYLGNTLEHKHGSIFEHATINFVIVCSRVATHEIVRHRAGTALSQESLRFVRFDDIPWWMPHLMKDNVEFRLLAEETLAFLEEKVGEMEQLFGFSSEEKMPFDQKKLLTTIIRRLMPMGTVTTLGMSANVRALRHMIEMRTSPHAEEEVRIIFAEIAAMMMARYPAAFQDFTVTYAGGLPVYTPKHSKV